MNLKLSVYAGMKICVALSGGRDSMALAHYLLENGAAYGITLSALNCDHCIRGEESARDSAFVKDWCEKNGVPLMQFVRNGCGDNTEASARSWRLHCYFEALKTGADAVATAHHLGDNAETVLFNLARGSGLSGLTGITDLKELHLIRPLISCSREEIDEYIEKNKIPYVDDSTNFTDAYTRNKIRHNVLPELEKAVPGAAKAIYRFSRLAAEDEEYFKRQIEKLLVKSQPYGDGILFCEERALFKRAAIKIINAYQLKDYTSEHAERLYRLQYAENGKKFGFLGLTAFKEDGKITIVSDELLSYERDGMPFENLISGQAEKYCGQFVAVTYNEYYEEDIARIQEMQSENPGYVPERIKCLKFDLDTIPGSAVIRFMKNGDKFKKYGGGTKNLGDFFTDRKIPVRIRKHIPLIAEGDKILAVGGVEISDDIKITDKTKRLGCIICADYAQY